MAPKVIKPKMKLSKSCLLVLEELRAAKERVVQKARVKWSLRIILKVLM